MIRTHPTTQPVSSLTGHFMIRFMPWFHNNNNNNNNNNKSLAAPFIPINHFLIDSMGIDPKPHTTTLNDQQHPTTLQPACLLPNTSLLQPPNPTIPDLLSSHERSPFLIDSQALYIKNTNNNTGIAVSPRNPHLSLYQHPIHQGPRTDLHASYGCHHTQPPCSASIVYPGPQHDAVHFNPHDQYHAVDCHNFVFLQNVSSTHIPDYTSKDVIYSDNGTACTDTTSDHNFQYAQIQHRFK
eukprot:UN01981